MVAKFGPVNGFGWKMGETVGMEILTVPLTQQLQGTLQLVLFLAGGLVLIFVVAYVALSIVFDSALVRPLSELPTGSARRVSLNWSRRGRRFAKSVCSPRRSSACV
jgi:hypothetical protein